MDLKIAQQLNTVSNDCGGRRSAGPNYVIRPRRLIVNELMRDCSFSIISWCVRGKVSVRECTGSVLALEASVPHRATGVRR